MQANVHFRPIQPVKKYPKRLELKLQVASRYKIRVCATYLNFDKVNVVEKDSMVRCRWMIPSNNRNGNAIATYPFYSLLIEMK